ncbi:hypothetical protein D0T90_02900 [Neisseria animalis]|uniref:Uncharacterized protein n=1 Tax=Neisseria animalis TaxID=492 RepID=A0A5P3MPT7_NEIAN|nr:hypothetical protein D0T90_02900 [Neisseria animalis]ROW32722.1 hypothetical protein CGZ60_02515 [Neisseria animalis]
MPCRTMCTVCGFAALSHSYFIRLYLIRRDTALSLCSKRGAGSRKSAALYASCRLRFAECSVKSETFAKFIARTCGRV